MSDIFECMDDLESSIVDIRVETLLNHLLIHSPTIDKYDPEVVSFAVDRTADFLLNYANDLRMHYFHLAKSVKQKKIVPASDQLGGQTDAETLKGCTAL